MKNKKEIVALVATTIIVGFLFFAGAGLDQKSREKFPSEKIRSKKSLGVSSNQGWSSEVSATKTKRKNNDLDDLTFSEKIPHLKIIIELGNENVLLELLNEFKALDSDDRMANQTVLYSKIADVVLEEENGLEWLHDNFDKINAVIDEDAGALFGAKLFEDLYWKMKIAEIDWEEKLYRLPEDEVKSVIREHLLSFAVFEESETARIAYEQLGKAEKKKVDQYFMEISAERQQKQNQSMALYLGGRGEQGLHQDLVADWFSQADWFLSEPEGFKEAMGVYSQGERKDIVIAELIKALYREGRSGYEGWFSEFYDSSSALKLKEELSKTN